MTALIKFPAKQHDTFLEKHFGRRSALCMGRCFYQFLDLFQCFCIEVIYKVSILKQMPSCLSLLARRYSIAFTSFHKRGRTFRVEKRKSHRFLHDSFSISKIILPNSGIVHKAAHHDVDASSYTGIGRSS